MGYTCPYCTTELPEGGWVCRGCGAELVIGTSRQEQATGAKLGALLGFVAYLWLLGQIRSLSFAFWHMVGMLGLGALAGTMAAVCLNRNQVRFFRRPLNY